jgi:hypothetical protein
MFSIFKRNRYGTDRVYQLDVNQGPEPLKDNHRRPHEHWGNRRITGADEWATWGYDELLRYFCTRTGITFLPAPADPSRIPWGKR